MTSDIEIFEQQCLERVRSYAGNESLQKVAKGFELESIKSLYSYNFKWMGVPIIQYPQDIMAMQEIIWTVKPDLIVETGVARGGSVLFYASMLELLGKGEIVGIDIDIRRHNREAIEAHPMSGRVSLLEGSSIAPEVVSQVKAMAEGKETVLVCLDSNHTHEHVKAELEAYYDLVTPGSYLVVFDTIVENLPDSIYNDRPWGVGDNPMTAVNEFLAAHDDFSNDADIEGKLLLTVAPGGYLRRTVEAK